MANGHPGPSTATAGLGGPKPAPAHTETGQSKRDLRSWWKNFQRSDKAKPDDKAPQGIFGVPLHTSIRYANVAISLFDEQGESYIYGYVPIVVAKCGVYLKEKATEIEGIFRLSGSEKRIKELKVAFDSPDRYGKGLDWTGYTVHDAANILRRYFNQLPEPIIPLEFYDRFRNPLRNHQAQAVGEMDAQSPSVGHFDQEAVIRAYQSLITELPPLNRQLLLYILDLLAVFASKSDLNKMTTANLAAIFQPGLLSHPQHDMAPQEYRLSQDVLIFLIENQDNFLVGMQGTAADPQTVHEIQSGTPSPSKQPTTPTTPNRAKTVVGRTSSNASVGAESVRKWGNIRRNVSVSSKHSNNGPSPVTPLVGSPATTGSGVHRSNTVPSKRSAAASPRFPREKTSDPPTPSPGAPPAIETAVQRSGSLQATPVATSSAGLFPSIAPPEVTSPSSSEATTPLATVGSDTASTVTRDYQTPKKDTTPLLAPAGNNSAERNPSDTPSTSTHGGFLNIFKQSPTSDSEGRKPNKLQKKRIPGSALSSAQSSRQSLQHDDALDVPHSVQSSPVAAAFPGQIQTDQPKEADHTPYTTAQTTPIQATPQRMPTDATLRPTVSPTHSHRSHTSYTDTSDADYVEDNVPASTEKPKEKRRWRFSNNANKNRDHAPSTSSNPLGSMTTREQQQSRSTIGSSTGPRRSFQEPVANSAETSNPAPPIAQPLQPSATDPVFSDSERERRGPMKWIRGKIQERKDKEAEKRAKTPPRQRGGSESKQSLSIANEAMPVRGKSMEMPRLVANSQTASQAPAAPPNFPALGIEKAAESNGEARKPVTEG